MPVGYLITVTLAGLLALLGLVSPRRIRLPRHTYIPTMPVNEYPFVLVVWLAASTVLVIQEGYGDSIGGWFAFVELAITLTVMAVVFARSVLARGVVSAALARDLGAHWQDDLDRGTLATLRRRMPRIRAIIVPWLVPLRGVRVEKNIRYGPDPRHNRLDMYRGAMTLADAPVFVFFHGGGYHGGGKSREARALLYRLARRGWVCISADYRIGPTAGFREHLVDAKRVIAWSRLHASGSVADPFVVGAGSSAGAHLTSVCALSAGDATLQPGFEGADTTLDAAVLLYGYYGYYYGLGRLDAPVSSPVDWDASPAPPTFLAHGDHDTFTPVQGARQMVSHLRSASTNPVVYAELPGGQHGFDVFRSVRFDAVTDGVLAFLGWAVARARAAHEGHVRAPDQ